MGRRLILQKLFVVCGMTAFCSAVGCASTPAGLRVTESNFAAWREHIVPQERELAWAEIPWLPSFGAGLLRADAEQMPLLLWVMNGHPLGCT